MNHNMHQGRDKKGRLLPATHCWRGHELNEANVYIYTRADGRVSRSCRPCRTIVGNAADKIRQKDFRQRIYTYLKSNPCVDCGENRIPTLQFDHIDPSTKKFAISRVINRIKDFSRIEAEIAKCEVRCANCHAIRTAEQQGWYKGLI